MNLEELADKLPVHYSECVRPWGDECDCYANEDFQALILEVIKLRELVGERKRVFVQDLEKRLRAAEAEAKFFKDKNASLKYERDEAVSWITGMADEIRTLKEQLDAN